jgi:peptidoglycan hydrolase CwlO-like protein
MITREKLASYNWTYIIIGTVLVAAIIVSIILSIMTYVKTTSDEKTISKHWDRITLIGSQLEAARTELDSLSEQVSEAEGQVASVNDQQALSIGILQDQLAGANNQISSLTNQLNNVLLQITNLSTEISSDSSAISLIQPRLTSITSELSALNTTAASLQNKITSLENKLNSLKATVDKLTTPVTHSVVLFMSQSISQTSGTQTLLYTLAAPYNGFISISGTSSSATGYIRVTNNTTSITNYYVFGTGANISVTITAGYNYSIYFGNSDATGTITATLSAIYYY